MTKFNTKQSNLTTNKAGGVAFSMNSETELIHAVLTTFLEDKFYEGGQERIERIANLVKQNRPEFVAKLAIVARNEFNLRSVSHVLIGELAKSHKGNGLVKRTIVKCAVRLDDLMEIVAYVGKPLPKQVKRGVRNALLKFSPYQLAKYRAEKKAVSLVDLFNLTHPKPQFASEAQKDAWAKLIKGELVSFNTWETELSNCKPEERKGKWEGLILENKLGYMALLRNLNNLIKYDVSVIDKVVKKLTNSEEIAKSKQLPFRWYRAFETVQGNRKLSDAISIAMDKAVGNVPELSGKTLIAVDCSGSMNGEAIEKASIFGSTLTKANSNAELILYSTDVKVLQVSSRTPVIDIAKHIQTEAQGGGTETSLVFKYAMSKGKYDRIIIISDNESWNESSVQEWYNEYRKTADPFVYAIDIQGYGTKDVTGSKVFHLAGLSNRLLDFIGRVEEGNKLTSHINDIQI